ncbi:MAG: agmatinase [marine benthic group bacterium]|nr:agmatinase [Gemmatimonadota bacterium]
MNGNPAHATFLRLPADATRGIAGSVIVPVPYDGTSTWQKGADAGPAALLEASAAVELYDIETAREPWRDGIRTLPVLDVPPDPEGMSSVVRETVAAILDRGELPVVLGGEHSVTIGAVDAAAGRFDDLTVLQIDAHADTREEYEGSSHNHACVMARARERCPIVQVGIRAVDASEMPGLDPARVFWAHDIAGAADDSWMDEVAGLLTGHVYVTIDLDAFDPSFIPATGTPEPGGLEWYPVNRLLRRVARASRVVGFDVVELLPAEGHHSSAFAAAKLVYRFLAEIGAARDA